MTPVIRVVGLGPGDIDLLTQRTFDLLREAPIVRLRTRVHPAAAAFLDVASYDDLYESAESFEALYDAIVTDLIELARNAPDGEVVYAVPGSPSSPSAPSSSSWRQVRSRPSSSRRSRSSTPCAPRSDATP